MASISTMYPPAMGVGLGREADATRARRWSSALFHLLVAGGAAAVIVGSYMDWATFYAGLIGRNGVDGQGKYFIGGAIAAIVAAALSTRTGVSPALRWLVAAAGAAIAVYAFRDIRNLNALINDPATGFYLPGRGYGLYVVFGGAVTLMLAVFARPEMPSLRPFSPSRTLAAVAAIAGTAVLVPGIYGQYYLHFASGHVHNHTQVTNAGYVLTISGALLFVAAARIAFFGSIQRKRLATTRRVRA